MNRSANVIASFPHGGINRQAFAAVGIFERPVGRRLGWLVIVPRCPEPVCGGIHHHRAASLEGTWVTARILNFLPVGCCPTWRSIVEAWQAARRAAADDYRAQVAQLPVDDTAWAAELERRNRIELSRSTIWTGEGVRYAS